MRLLRLWSTLALLTAGWLSACGSNDSASTFGNTTGGNGATGGKSGAGGSGGRLPEGGIITTGGTGGQGTGGAGGGFDPDAKVCGGIDVGVETVPFNMLIMFDQSVSMADYLDGVAPPTRWDAVTSALIEFFQSADAQPLGVGLAYFEQIDPTTSATSCRLQDYSTPEVEIAPMTDPGQVQKLVDSIKKHYPTGYTPTAPALQGALDHAKTYTMAHPGKKTMVVLATDGIPTQCMPNTSYDIADTIAGPAFKGTPSIRTFIVAAAPNLSSLSAISSAGGTGSPVFVTDPKTTSDQIKTAFNRLTRTNLACSYKIPAGGEAGATNPGLVNVLISSQGQPDRTLQLYANPSSCGDGWYYDNPMAPQNILLCPDTCASLFNGSLRIVVGCAGPPPK